MYDTLLFDLCSVSIGSMYRFSSSLQAELNSPEGVWAEPDPLCELYQPGSVNKGKSNVN